MFNDNINNFPPDELCHNLNEEQYKTNLINLRMVKEMLDSNYLENDERIEFENVKKHIIIENHEYELKIRKQKLEKIKSRINEKA